MKARALPFTVVYLLPILIVSGYIMGGLWNFIAPFTVFVLIPLTDLLIGVDRSNPTEEEADARKDAFDYKFVTWISVPIQVGFMVWGAYIIGTKELPFIDALGLAFSIGIQGGAMGINIAHEMCHRGKKWERRMAITHLVSVGYAHWWLEHVAGHHKNVATPGDPATARYGESFYKFWPRTVIGSFKSAWEIEKKIMSKRNHPVWSLHNRIITYILGSSAVLVALTALWGWKAFVYFIFQSIIAFSLLEVVNYLEHYGLARRQLEDGSFEKVTPIHSWNASEMITNHFLFNLQRHSDHHSKPHLRYQNLRHFDEAPQLPTGYAGMVLIALVPPLWFALMNPRVPEDMIAIARENQVRA